MPGQHGTSLRDYTQALTIQLRLREIPGRMIGQIVAEVESHVRETGEDPVEAFGQPGSYSAQFAPGLARARVSQRRGAVRARPRASAAVAVTVVGCLMLFKGLFSLNDAVPITAKAILSWVAVGLLIALIALPVSLALEDRRTRTVMAGGGSAMSRTEQWLRFLALWGALLAGQAIDSLAPQGPVLLRGPGWALLLVGLSLAFVSLWGPLRRTDRIVDPRGR